MPNGNDTISSQSMELYKLTIDLKQIQSVLLPIQEDIKLLNKLATEYGLLIKMLTEAYDKQNIEIEDIEKIVSSFTTIRHDVESASYKFNERLTSCTKEMADMRKAFDKMSCIIEENSKYIQVLKNEAEIRDKWFKRIPIIVTVCSTIGAGLIWFIKYIISTGI